MIATFTDFTTRGPYLGQMRAVLMRGAPGVPVVDLMNDVPAFEVRAAAYLLAALAPSLAAGDVLLGVVDPGVGSTRRAVALQADAVWYVGPDNGLFEIVRRRAARVEEAEIVWRPATVSASFHGRDLFAPIAARLARGSIDGLQPMPLTRFADWSDDRHAVIYVDGYGNLMTGIRGETLEDQRLLHVRGREIPYARVFSEGPPNMPFWYRNSLGLVEISLDCGSAAAHLRCGCRTPVSVLA